MIFSISYIRRLLTLSFPHQKVHVCKLFSHGLAILRIGHVTIMNRCLLLVVYITSYGKVPYYTYRPGHKFCEPLTWFVIICVHSFTYYKLLNITIDIVHFLLCSSNGEHKHNHSLCTIMQNFAIKTLSIKNWLTLAPS